MGRVRNRVRVRSHIQSVRAGPGGTSDSESKRFVRSVDPYGLLATFVQRKVGTTQTAVRKGFQR